MRITALHIENFKRISEVDITPAGDRALILIGGKNAAGKSSLMDALTAAFGGKGALPADPVKHGAEAAEIRVELDGGALTIRRTIKDGESTLELRDADGKLASPQARLDRLVSNRFLDPIAFNALSAKDQRKALLALIDKDGAIAKLDERRQRVFERRTEAGRDHKRAAAQLEGMPRVEVPPIVSVAEILAEVKQLEVAARGKVNAEHAVKDAKIGLASLEAEAARLALELEALALRLEKVEAEIEARREHVANAEAALAAAPAPDEARREKLQEQLRTASDRNAEAARLEAAAKQRHALAGEVERLHGSVTALTEEIELIDNDKAARLAAAALPVAGLGVDADGIRFNGVPLAQASGAEQLRVALALAIAASPNLRDVWVRDGSLMDDETLASLEVAAREAGCRVWCERVGDRDPGAIIIEAGRIRGAKDQAA